MVRAGTTLKLSLSTLALSRGKNLVSRAPEGRLPCLREEVRSVGWAMRFTRQRQGWVLL